MTQQRPDRGVFVSGTETWLSLPLHLQLSAILNCAHFNGWSPDIIKSQIRHWMSMVSSDAQIEAWGDSLFDTNNPESNLDGDRMMDVIKYVAENVSRYHTG